MTDLRLSPYARFTEAREFLNLAPPPAAALAHTLGTDIESDAPLLWSATVLMKPRLIVELGTRTGVSTRTLAHAAKTLGADLITIDPDPACRGWLEGVDCFFMQMTFEEAFDRRAVGRPADVLFIDVDPHSYEQTARILDTWIPYMLAPGGLAMFHDVVPARLDIQVENAILDWLGPRGPGVTGVTVTGDFVTAPERPYVYRKFVASHGGTPLAYGPYGLGLLWSVQ